MADPATLPISHRLQSGVYRRRCRISRSSETLHSSFSLRMEAHLALGEPQAAYADFQEGMQSYRALAEEPSLIAGMVQGAAISCLVSSIGAGLRDHHWPDVELEKIEHDLEVGASRFGLPALHLRREGVC